MGVAKFLLTNERGGSCFGPKALSQVKELQEIAKTIPSGVNGAMSGNTDITNRLAELQLSAEALEFTELRILASISQGRDPGPESSLTKLISSNLRQEIQIVESELYAYGGLQLPYARPLYGNQAPEPVGSHAAQNAMAKYLNGRATTIYGGSNEVQKNIIAKRVLGL